MAVITKTLIPFDEAAQAVGFSAATGDDCFIPDNSDGRISILVKNGNTQDAVIALKAGDGALSALGDVSVTVPGGAQYFIPLERIETARVKVMSGDDKGKIFISTSVATGGDVTKVSLAAVSVE